MRCGSLKKNKKSFSQGSYTHYTTSTSNSGAILNITYYGARYLDPKTSRWLSTDPALGEYVPVAPLGDIERKRNGNLSGMGGVFNVVNLHVYHYGGNNPVRYVDPDGRWINNGDGTFTAEKGDTLWSLQQETGRDWKSSDFNGDPHKLQIGQTVSFAARNENNSFVTVDSTPEATAHYFFGDGTPANIGQNTIEALKAHPDHLLRQGRITRGETESPFAGNYGVNMTNEVFFIGNTTVHYSATYGSKFAVIDFTAFVQDGFWDVLDLWNSGGDGIGPRYEAPGGKPYSFVPHKWTISVPNLR